MNIRELPYSLVIRIAHDYEVVTQRGYLFTDRYMDEVVESTGKSLRDHLRDPVDGDYETSVVGLSSLSDVEWDCSSPLEGFTITHIYLVHDYATSTDETT